MQMWAGSVNRITPLASPLPPALFMPQVVERFTAHYVFCLGLSRFLSCAHWILQVSVCVCVCVWGGILSVVA